MNDKRWIGNASDLIIVNSIFAAIAGILLVFVLGDSCLDHCWYVSLIFLFSFFLFALTAERITEAIGQKSTKTHVAYMFPYNFAVILLFLGICLIVHFRYNFSLVVSLIVGFVLSFPWLYDAYWLVFVKEDKFNQYLNELDGFIEPSPYAYHRGERLFYSLRKIVNHIRNKCKCKLSFPHDGVYTRLQCSKVHGIGVFAIRDIPKGTNIFSNDDSEMVWVDEADIRNISSELKKLYDDFCVIKNGKYGCPKNFNMLTVGWYLNKSKENPNVRCTNDYDFIALRDIKKGEELTVDYSTYSESPKINEDEDK
jgi:uncharacterized protein